MKSGVGRVVVKDREGADIGDFDAASFEFADKICIVSGDDWMVCLREWSSVLFYPSPCAVEQSRSIAIAKTKLDCVNSGKPHSQLSVRSRKAIRYAIQNHGLDAVSGWGVDDWTQMKRCGITSANEIMRFLSECP